MKQTPPVGVILAGGRGTRMHPFSDERPKPLLPVGNIPIIERHILEMHGLGIRDVIIVVGHLGHAISETIGDGARLGVRVRYVQQDNPRGIAHAAALCEPLIHGPFLLFLGDIYFVASDMGKMLRMLEADDVGAVLAVTREEDTAAIRTSYAVLRADDGRVLRVIEKPRHPPTHLKGCGLYLFDVRFFDAIRRTPRSVLRDEYEITDAIQVFIDDGHRVEAAEVIEYDVNVTSPEDLWRVNMLFLASHGGASLVDPGAELGPGVSVESSVVGAGARIAAGVSVVRSVVLAGSVVERDVTDCVVTPQDVVQFEASK